MKTIKYLFFLIICIVVAALVFFNQEYFLAKVALSVTVKDMVYTIPEIQTIVYFGICFFLGLLISGMGTISAKLCLGRTIKERDADISALTLQVNELSTELSVFKNDPYIKKGLEDKPMALPQPDSIKAIETSQTGVESNEPANEPSTEAVSDPADQDTPKKLE